MYIQFLQTVIWDKLCYYYQRPQNGLHFVDSIRMRTIEMKHFAIRRLTEMAKSRGIAMDSGERAKPVRFDLEPGIPLI